MSAEELMQAVTARGRASAAKNATSAEFADAYLVGWLQEELTSALTVIAAADTPAARHYMERLQARISTPPLS